MLHKTIPYRRHQRKKHINHKIKIIEKCWHEKLWQSPGHLDKGKVFCSCWMCSGSYKSWSAGHKKSELQKLERAKDIDGD